MTATDDPRREDLEALLRAAMSAKADAVTPQSLRPAAPPARDGSTRRKKTLTVVIPLSVAAAVAATAMFTGLSRGDKAASRDNGPAQSAVPTSVSPSPDPTGTPTAPASSTAPAVPSTPVAPSTGGSNPATGAAIPPVGAPTGRTSQATNSSNPPSSSAPAGTPREDVRGVKYQLPSGWRAEKVDAFTVCLLPPNAAAGPDCAARGLVLGHNMPENPSLGGSWPLTASMSAQAGWSGQPECFADGRRSDSIDLQNSRLDQHNTRTVGGRSALYSVWTANCVGEPAFKVRTWYVANLGFYADARALPGRLDADVDRIVASLDLATLKVRTA